MVVKELIAALQDLPPDMVVEFVNHETEESFAGLFPTPMLISMVAEETVQVRRFDQFNFVMVAAIR